MKNLKKIIIMILVNVLCIHTNKASFLKEPTARLFLKRIFFSPTVTAVTSYPFFSYLSEIAPGNGIEHLYIPFVAASLAYSGPLTKKLTTHFMTYEKEKGTLFPLTRKQKKEIENRFNKYKRCEELIILIKKDAKYTDEASVASLGSKTILYLPKNFFRKNSVDVQKSIIAHEATHFSKGHTGQRLRLQYAVNVTSILPLMLPLIDLEPSYLSSSPMSSLIAWLLIKKSLTLIQTRRQEREADLEQKTPEELLCLIKTLLSFYESTDMYEPPYHYPGYEKEKNLFVNTELKKLLSVKKEKRSLLCEKYFKKIPLLIQITREHPPLNERLEYFCNQFEQQILNPRMHDTPQSVAECKDALSFYFEKESDYETALPIINTPLVQKRVDFLRAKLIELENKKA